MALFSRQNARAKLQKSARRKMIKKNRLEKQIKITAKAQHSTTATKANQNTDTYRWLCRRHFADRIPRIISCVPHG